MTHASPTPLSIDDIFRRTVTARPDTDALIDPADKLRVTGEAPLRLSFREADQAISNLAQHFIDSGLSIGSVIAVQQPNTVETMLVMLAGFRAGLVVAPIPLLWRQSELSDALNRIGARSFVTTAKIGGVDYCELAMNAAADAFSIRHVGVFGDNLPDGISPLSTIMRQPAGDVRFPPSDPRRASLITFDVTTDGARAIPRTQVQLIAGGLAVFLDAGLAAAPKLLSAVMPSSFAGLCMSLIPWLLCGDSLALHHPLDPDVLTDQLVSDRATTLFAPAALALRLNDAERYADAASLRKVIGLWRAPEQVASSADWVGRPGFCDIYAFGEAGIVVRNRGSDGAAAPLVGASASLKPGASCELIVTPQGKLSLRGTMAPSAAYATVPDNVRDGDPIDTGYAARMNTHSGDISITAPPAGLVSVGGYRFLSNDLDAWAQRLPQGGMLAALPDRMNGHRLAGRAGDNPRARSTLTELGLNPLMIEAFRDRNAG